jgi:hypothetical protein
MSGKQEIKTTFMMPEDMSDWVSMSISEIDRTKSEVIRTCILLSLDTVRSMPSLTNRIRFEDRFKQPD